MQIAWQTMFAQYIIQAETFAFSGWMQKSIWAGNLANTCSPSQAGF